LKKIHFYLLAKVLLLIFVCTGKPVISSTEKWVIHFLNCYLNIREKTVILTMKKRKMKKWKRGRNYFAKD